MCYFQASTIICDSSAMVAVQTSNGGKSQLQCHSATLYNMAQLQNDESAKKLDFAQVHWYECAHEFTTKKHSVAIYCLRSRQSLPFWWLRSWDLTDLVIMWYVILALVAIHAEGLRWWRCEVSMIIRVVKKKKGNYQVVNQGATTYGCRGRLLEVSAWNDLALARFR